MFCCDMPVFRAGSGPECSMPLPRIAFDFWAVPLQQQSRDRKDPPSAKFAYSSTILRRVSHPCHAGNNILCYACVRWCKTFERFCRADQAHGCR